MVDEHDFGCKNALYLLESSLQRLRRVDIHHVHSAFQRVVFLLKEHFSFCVGLFLLFELVLYVFSNIVDFVFNFIPLLYLFDVRSTPNKVIGRADFLQ